jgi:hypothetical protein
VCRPNLWGEGSLYIQGGLGQRPANSLDKRENGALGGTVAWEGRAGIYYMMSTYGVLLNYTVLSKAGGAPNSIGDRLLGALPRQYIVYACLELFEFVFHASIHFEPRTETPRARESLVEELRMRVGGPKAFHRLFRWSTKVHVRSRRLLSLYDNSAWNRSYSNHAAKIPDFAFAFE